MQPLHVAHVLRKLDGTQWGGTESHLASLLPHLASLGYEASVWAPEGGAPTGDALGRAVPVHRFGTLCPYLAPAERRQALRAAGGNLLPLGLPLRLLARRALRLAHLHTQGRIGGAVRAAMALRGAPYVVSLHGPVAAQPELVREATARWQGGARDLGAPAGWLLGARRVLEEAARVFVFNAEEHRALEPRLGARVKLLSHGVDAQRLASGDATRGRARLGLESRGPVCLLLGRVCEQKNQLLAVRAFARGAPAEATLVLAGPETDGGYLARVLHEARALGVAERVRAVGALEARREVPDALAACDLVLVPSRHEAFGLVALEAWAAGKPALLAPHSGLAELAGTQLDGWPRPQPLAVEPWAEALRAVLAQPALGRAEAARAVQLVRERFQWSHSAQRLAEQYAEVLEEAARGRKGAQRR